MIPAKINYDIHDKKLLVIVITLQKWKIYLKDSKYSVKMFTNHKNLT
jgi:hypothetical protein